MSVKILTSSAKTELRSVFEEEAKAAAGNNQLVSLAEQAKLGSYLLARAREIRSASGPGTRVKVESLVDAAILHSMNEWEKANPPLPVANGKYLSRAEVNVITKHDPALGAVSLLAYERAKSKAGSGSSGGIPTITLTTDHPGASLERTGNIYRLRSDQSGAVTAPTPRRTATLSFDGHQIQLTANGLGLFNPYEIAAQVPEGYFGEFLGVAQEGAVTVASFAIGRDPAGSISSGAALQLARDGLLEYVRDVRRHEPDWTSALAVPTTWEGLVAAGILEQIGQFGSLSPGSEAALHRGKDQYTFVGRGPFDLYTEMGVRKTDGAIVRAYVEID